MNPIALLPILAYRFGKAVFGTDNLTWSEVREWIAKAGNRSDYGRGYAGNQLSSAPSNAFAELRREQVGEDRFRLVASIFFDPKQGVSASRTWEGKRLDSELEKIFGRNMRIRLDI